MSVGSIRQASLPQFAEGKSRLLLLAYENPKDAEEMIKGALSEENLFKKMITSNQEVDELGQLFPQHANELYFVWGQALEQQGKPKEAFAYYLKAAENGFKRAQTNLGNCYLNGNGIGIDKKKAARWFLEAAKQGHLRGQLNLANMLEFGDGVPFDADGAKHWYQLAADQGNDRVKANAKAKLDALQKKFDVSEEYFSQGYRLEKEGDFPNAFIAYQAAAKQDHLGARDRIAFYYLQGKGVQVDKKQAYDNFLEGAKQGYLRSMFNLAVMLELGDGIPVDSKEARYWYQEAANKGSQQAIDRLSSMDTPRKPASDQKDTDQVPLESLYFNQDTPQILQIDPSLQPKLGKNEVYRLIPAGKTDIETVIKCYQHHPVKGYELGQVEIIYNPHMESAFTSRSFMLEQRAGNPSFKPDLDKETNPAWRREDLKYYKKISEPHKNMNFPHLMFFGGWHGTNPKILDSIFRAGYANLATTDPGYFGKGMNFAHEAEYSYRVYSKGALILNWVQMFSIFSVIDGDRQMLLGKGVHGNFDGHGVKVSPVNPNNSNEKVYHETKLNQKHTYTELIVFEAAQCLARYLVHLQPILPKSPSLSVGALEDSESSSSQKKKHKHKGSSSKK